ncbi:hypothetical protein H9P43_009492 [Blastocladiella emersonii ATCC 22665]|nr:hypothetical protein H9P43_009492 [Blastocladiella emersonii ATCC 22665]
MASDPSANCFEVDAERVALGNQVNMQLELAMRRVRVKMVIPTATSIEWDKAYPLDPIQLLRLVQTFKELSSEATRCADALYDFSLLQFALDKLIRLSAAFDGDFLLPDPTIASSPSPIAGTLPSSPPANLAAGSPLSTGSADSLSAEALDLTTRSLDSLDSLNAFLDVQTEFGTLETQCIKHTIIGAERIRAVGATLAHATNMATNGNTSSHSFDFQGQLFDLLANLTIEYTEAVDLVMDSLHSRSIIDRLRGRLAPVFVGVEMATAPAGSSTAPTAISSAAHSVAALAAAPPVLAGSGHPFPAFLLDAAAAAAFADQSAFFPGPAIAFADPSAFLSVPETTFADPSAIFSGPATAFADPMAYFLDGAAAFADPSAFFSGATAAFADPSLFFSGPATTFADQSAFLSGPATAFADPMVRISDGAGAFADPSAFLSGPATTFPGPLTFSGSAPSPAMTTIDLSWSLLSTTGVNAVTATAVPGAGVHVLGCDYCDTVGLADTSARLRTDRHLVVDCQLLRNSKHLAFALIKCLTQCTELQETITGTSEWAVNDDVRMDCARVLCDQIRGIRTQPESALAVARDVAVAGLSGLLAFPVSENPAGVLRTVFNRVLKSLKKAKNAME